MKAHNAFACLTAAFCISAGTWAQEKPVEISGVQIGQGIQQAYAAVKAHAAELQATGAKVRIGTMEGRWFGFEKPVPIAIQVDILSMAGRDQAMHETFEVTFSSPPGEQKVVRIDRLVGYYKEKPARDAVMAALRERFGPEQQIIPDNFGWHWKQGKPVEFGLSDAQCAAVAMQTSNAVYPMETAGLPDCGVIVQVSIAASQNRALLEVLHITASDKMTQVASNNRAAKMSADANKKRQDQDAEKARATQGKPKI